jgi:hypothetical protein
MGEGGDVSSSAVPALSLARSPPGRTIPSHSFRGGRPRTRRPSPHRRHSGSRPCKAGLQALKEFEAKYPPLANNPMIVRAKLSLLPKIGEGDEAKKAAEAVAAKAIKRNNSSALMQVAALLRNGPG